MSNAIKSLLISLALTIVIGSNMKGYAQNFGVSFSYFLPKDGYFSTPISPFSFRGVGVDLNRFLAIETGITLYRMSGMSVTDIPFETSKPILGPNFTILVPLELVIQFRGARQEFKIRGGGFGFLPFDTKLDQGNLDRALREFEGWEVLNSNFELDNKIGGGILFGAEYILYLTDKFGITLGASYFIGSSKLNLKGSYVGGNSGQPFETVDIEYSDSKLDFTGIEISLGAIFSSQ